MLHSYCSQTAADRNVVTFDSLCKVAVALSNNTIAERRRLPTTYRLATVHALQTDRRQTHDIMGHIVPQKQGQ